MGDLLAEPGSLRVRGAEMDASPHSGVDDLFERVRESVEAPRGTGFVAERAESDPVGTEEVLERIARTHWLRRRVPRGGRGRAA